MEIDQAIAGDARARKASDDNDQLSAFRRSNDELTFRDFLMGRGTGRGGEAKRRDGWATTVD